jgi:hypothetical protein
MMHGDGRVDQIASERPQPRQNPVLVGSGKPENPTTSDTKIAASFRVSLTAQVPKLNHRSQMAWARLHFHAALIETRGGPGMQTRRSVISLAAPG